MQQGLHRKGRRASSLGLNVGRDTGSGSRVWEGFYEGLYELQALGVVVIFEGISRAHAGHHRTTTATTAAAAAAATPPLPPPYA